MYDKPRIELQANAFAGRGPSPEQATTEAIFHLHCWLDTQRSRPEIQHLSTAQGTVQHEDGHHTITEHTFTITILYLTAI
jgi:hypothetical protein